MRLVQERYTNEGGGDSRGALRFRILNFKCLIVEGWEGEKVDSNYELRSGLSGLCVIRFSRYKKRPEGGYPSGPKTNQDFATSF